MQIDFKTIPHSEQRYNTCGDYWFDGGTWYFRVSKLSNRRYEILVFIHELVEWAWVLLKEIPVQQIDDFDKSFTGDGEPGDDPDAPYHFGHTLASSIEFLVSKFLGVEWKDYENEINAL